MKILFILSVIFSLFCLSFGGIPYPSTILCTYGTSSITPGLTSVVNYNAVYSQANGNTISVDFFLSVKNNLKKEERNKHFFE